MFCTRVAWVCLICLLLCKEDGSSPVSVELSTMSGCSVLDNVVTSGDDVFVVLLGTLVCLMWSEWLLTSSISFPMWSSVYKYHRVECAFTSPVRTECDMFVMYCMQCCMLVSAIL